MNIRFLATMAFRLDKMFCQVCLGWLASHSNGLAEPRPFSGPSSMQPFKTIYSHYFSVTKQGTKRLKRFADPHYTAIWFKAFCFLRGLKSFSEETAVLSKKAAKP
ncbi:MAG: hypothetical protein ACK4VN_00020 [Bacteroidales bacterium]